VCLYLRIRPAYPGPVVQVVYLVEFQAVALLHGCQCNVSWLERSHREVRRGLSPILMHCQPVWEARFVDARGDLQMSVADLGSGAVLFVRVGPLLRPSTSMCLDFLTVSSMLRG
jgi:hypothetical protein